MPVQKCLLAMFYLSVCCATTALSRDFPVTSLKALFLDSLEKLVLLPACSKF